VARLIQLTEPKTAMFLSSGYQIRVQLVVSICYGTMANTDIIQRSLHILRKYSCIRLQHDYNQDSSHLILKLSVLIPTIAVTFAEALSVF
jgi:hypothetical protein